MNGPQFDQITVFDREQVRRNRDRAAPGFDDVDFLVRESADRLTDRLRDIARVFPAALDLGCRTGLLSDFVTGMNGIQTLIQADLSPGMAARADRGGRPAVAADEEWLPFAEESFDLVLSNLSLHWVNDLPGALIQINRALKADGLFLGAMLGGETLKELRDVMAMAEVELRDGLSPRVSPFADLRDAGALMQRAGFALPVIDSDTITVTYGNPLTLMQELRKMGEGNAVTERSRRPLGRDILMRAAELYVERYAGPDGRVPATFEIIYLHGWAPHETQQKPLRPGSARNRLAAALDAEEQSAGEKPNGTQGS